ncbi:hypothetical protein AX16_003018 [Volvariella volvacea WC 439]|nr:hypothetical protein AX16_003018 [Volvariella volvacea WC 439]
MAEVRRSAQLCGQFHSQRHILRPSVADADDSASALSGVVSRSIIGRRYNFLTTAFPGSLNSSYDRKNTLCPSHARSELPPSQKEKETLVLILPHTHRISELDFSFSACREGKHPQVLQLLSQPAPSLRCLRVSRCNYDPPESRTFFNTAVPALRHLELARFSLPQDTLIPFHPSQQLTHLRLVFVSISLPPTQFVDALCALPNLTHLSIEYSIRGEWDLDNLDTNPTPAILSTVTHLSLIDYGISSCGEFLSLVSLDPEADIEISGGFFKEDDLDLVSYIRDLSVPSLSEIEYRMASVSDGNHKPGGLKLELGVENYINDFDLCYRDVFLCIDIAERDWREIFGRMENLEKLVVVWQDLDLGLECLENLIHALDVPSTDSITLPHLKSLAFPECLPLEGFDPLCDCLKRRKEKGYALESLLFWDGIEDGYYARYGELGLQFEC